MNRTNYIFVDFENVHDVDLDLIAGKPVVVTLVLGKLHKTLPMKMAKQFLKYANQIKLTETGCSGRNALDFVLACQIGVEATNDPSGYFHIVSRDTGFDALVLHLKEEKILARRDESFASAFGVAGGNLPTPEDRFKLVVERLTKNKKNRPARRKTLLSQINAHFGKMLPEAELNGTLDALVAAKVIHITPSGGVEYKV